MAMKISTIKREKPEPKIAETRTCRDCGEQFDITEGEAAWYEDKGYALPARCPACRKARKTKTAETGEARA